MVFTEVAKSVRIAADFVAVLSPLIVKSLNYLCGPFLNMNLVRAWSYQFGSLNIMTLHLKSLLFFFRGNSQPRQRRVYWSRQRMNEFLAKKELIWGRVNVRVLELQYFLRPLLCLKTRSKPMLEFQCFSRLQGPRILWISLTLLTSLFSPLQLSTKYCHKLI